MAEKNSREDREGLEKSARQMGELTYKLSLDTGDALKGLKAIQREARKATQALKELEELQNRTSAYEDEERMYQEKADAAYDEYLSEKVSE